MRDPAAALLRLEQLPFVTAVSMDESASVARVQTPAGPFELQLSIERSFLSTGRVDDLVGTAHHHEVLVLAPLVSGESAARLAAAGANYVDDAGNLRLALGERYLAQIEGKTLPPPERPAGIRSAGYRVLFALMAWPELAGRPQREIGERAGTSRTAVSALLQRLTQEGHLLGRDRRRRLVVGEELLRRWTVGYTDILRPALFIRRYRMPQGGREVLVRRLEAMVEDRYAWGGGMAASRLGGTFVGERVTLHVRESSAALPLSPDPHGPIHVLRIPGPLAWHSGSPTWDGGGVQSAHPLLVHAELMDQRGDRALRAAADLRAQFDWGSE